MLPSGEVGGENRTTRAPVRCGGTKRTRKPPDRLVRADHPYPLRNRFQRPDVPGQFLRRRPALEVQADHLEGSLGRLASGPQAHQQRGQHGHVHLQRHPLIRRAQPVRASQDTLEPTEEQLSFPRTLQAKTQLLSMEPLGR